MEYGCQRQFLPVLPFNPRTLALVKIFCSNAPAATLTVSRIRKRNIFDFGKTLAHDGGAFAGSACMDSVLAIPVL